MKEQVNERVCRCCASGEVEDELHFMLQCSVYHDLRTVMWSKFEEATGCNRASFRDSDEQLNALIGYLFQPSAVNKGKAVATVKQTYNNVARCVMTFITTAMKRRRILLG